MPHKRAVDRVEAPPDLVPLLGKLAKALGVTDDTITQWRRRGLVVGGSGGWSITGTYLAARKAGLKPRLPDDARLVALIEEGMVGVRAAQREQEDRAARATQLSGDFQLPGHSAYDELFRGQPIRKRSEAIEREALIGEELKNKALNQKIDTERGKLVTKDEAAAAAASVRDAFIGLGKQLWPKVDTRLGEMPSAARQQVAMALQAAWDELLAGIAL